MRNPSEVTASWRKQVCCSSWRVSVFSFDIDIQDLIADHKLIEIEGGLLIRCALSHKGIKIKHFLLLALRDVLDLDVA